MLDILLANSGSTEVILAKSGLAVARSFSLENVRVCQAGCLAASDQVVPDWLNIPSLGEAVTGIKSWIGDLGFNISDSILGLLPCF